MRTLSCLEVLQEIIRGPIPRGIQNMDLLSHPDFKCALTEEHDANEAGDAKADSMV